MATGYTYELLDKPDTTLAEFAMRCARAFGACIEMRDASFDAVIPDAIEPAPYIREALDKAYAAHREAETMTLAEAELRATANYERQLAERKEYEASHERNTAIFSRMLAEIDAWTPPSKDHEGLKKFMHDQVATSITKRWEYAVTRKTGSEWLEALRKDTAESVTRAARDWEAARRSAAERTKWLRDLRGSL